MRRAYGRAIIKPEKWTVGERAVWSVMYTVGARVISVGGGIRITFQGRQCLYGLQVDEEKEADYVTASASFGARLSVETVSGFMYYEVTVVAKNKALEEGDVIVVTFGGTSNGGGSFRVRPYSHKQRMDILVDSDGSRNYVKLPDPPSLEFVSDKAVNLVLLAPSTVKTGECFNLLLKSVDKYGNLATSYRGKVKVFILNKLIEDCIFSSESKGIKKISNVKLNNAGTFRLGATDEESSLKTESNPIEVKEKSGKYRIYWGEIHGHTLLSDGLETPDYYYRYARDIERLDFSAITDHDSIAKKQGGKYLFSPFWQGQSFPWDIVKYETDRFNEPGRFVTFLGYEWTSSHANSAFGHKNVYYLSDDEPMYNSYDPESDTPGKLYHLLRHKEAIIIPHHSSLPLGLDRGGGGTDWNYHDDNLQPLVEIYSKWGSSEYLGNSWPVVFPEPEGCVQEALKRGYRLGFTAGSDTHISRPGSNINEMMGHQIVYAQSGLTAVYAEQLSREGIFDALRKRHCYATTGVRMLIYFTVNDYVMGEEITVQSPDAPRQLYIRVAGTKNIERIDVVRNNKNIFSKKSDKLVEEVTYVDRDNLRDIALPIESETPPLTFYYIRVIQKDGNWGWSSPIWVSTTS